MWSYQWSCEEAKAFEKVNKDILVFKYSFRTEPISYERDFLNRTTRYYVSKYTAGPKGESIAAEIVKYKGLFFHGLAHSKKFIYEHIDEMDWSDISKNVKLRENFIREFKDYLDWKYICRNQKLKKSFIIEMKKYTKKYMKDFNW